MYDIFVNALHMSLQFYSTSERMHLPLIDPHQPPRSPTQRYKIPFPNPSIKLDTTRSGLRLIPPSTEAVNAVLTE